MKKNDLNISPRYIVDHTGKKVEVVLDVKMYESMLEHLEDTYFGEQAKKALKEGEFVSFEDDEV